MAGSVTNDLGPLHAGADRVPPVGGPAQLTLISGATFAISDRRGDITGGTEGLVHDDRRFLSRFALRVDDVPLTPIATATPSPSSAVVIHRLRDGAGHERPALLLRRRRLDGSLRDDLELWATGHDAVASTLRLAVGADFAHIFEVKRGVGRPAATPRVLDDGVVLVGDGDENATRIRWNRAPTFVDAAAGEVVWRLQAEPGQRVTLSVVAEPVTDGRTARVDPVLPVLAAEPEVFRRTAAWSRDSPIVTSTDARLSIAVDQAVADLSALRMSDGDRVVVAAGAPWFMTLFGRDSLLTSWMTLPFDVELAAGVLTTLAELQGTSDDPVAEEEPGKILHEVRHQGGGGPFGVRARYFGSVDATPLFVVTVAEAWRWGALTSATLDRLAPAIRAALRWIDANAADGGFVTYRRRDDRGLANQGWKDSWDGVMFFDGSLPDPPIALVEVQGYTYAALHGAADLAGVMSLDVDPAALRARAEHLKDRFNDEFWDRRGYFVIALDGHGRQVDALTTNPGHALWTGIADAQLADRYLDRVTAPDIWSGWGLRTLAEGAGAFDPLSYHNGSVWPHDTAICAVGAARYRRWDVVDLIVDGALDAAAHYDGRPPELFAGVARADVPVPVAYPASCSPQAWSSASILLLVRTMVGMEPAVDGIKIARDDLGPVGELTIRGIRIHGRVGQLRIADGTASWQTDPTPTPPGSRGDA
ncbi:MAG: glycogen debranching N-terminal domain-containing protein [Ilumatobacteraceae bacterium]